MGRNGHVNVRQLEDFRNRLQDIAENNDDFLEACTKELAARLLAKVIKRTPVGDYSKEVEVVAKRDSKNHSKGDTYTKKVPDGSGKTGGTLRSNWTIGEIQKVGSLFKIEVINPTEYASYVEYGHRQRPGRYVPALGKTLKKAWVKGKFMLTISEQEIENTAPAILETKLQKYLKEKLK